MIMIMMIMIMIIIIMIKKNLHSVLKLEFSSLLSAPLAGIKIIFELTGQRNFSSVKSLFFLVMFKVIKIIQERFKPRA